MFGQRVLELIFLVSAKNRDISQQAAQQLEQELKNSSVIQSVQGKVTAKQIQDLQTSLKQLEYFHINDHDQQLLENYSSTPQGPDQHPIIQQALSRLYSPMGAVIAKDIHSDPLQLFFNWQMKAMNWLSRCSSKPRLISKCLS